VKKRARAVHRQSPLPTGSVVRDRYAYLRVARHHHFTPGGRRRCRNGRNFFGTMGTTKQIPRAEWKAYFDEFTRQHLQQHLQKHLHDDEVEVATIEVVSPLVGDQFEARDARLLGLGFDPKSDVFEVLLEGVDHLVFHPKEIWVIEEQGGFPLSIELVRDDDERELLYVYRSEAHSQQEQAASPPT
jgi:hypothetical protein